MGCLASKPSVLEQSGRGHGEPGVKTPRETSLAGNDSKPCPVQAEHHNGVLNDRISDSKETPTIHVGEKKGKEEGISQHDVTVRGLSVSDSQTPIDLKQEHKHDPKTAAVEGSKESQQHSHSAGLLKTDEPSSSRTSASHGEPRSFLHPLLGQAISSSRKSKESHSGGFAGFAVVGSAQPQAETPPLSNGHTAAAAWHGSAAAKPPKSPLASDQQASALHKLPPERPQGQQQLPMWHNALFPPNSFQKSSNHVPASPDSMSPPPTRSSDQTELGLKCPSKELISRETSMRSSGESSAAAVQHHGLLGVTPNNFSHTYSLESKNSCPAPGTQDANSGRFSLADNGGLKGGNIRRPGSPAMSRLGYATGPRANTMELPHTDPIAEHDSAANSQSCGANITFSQSFIQPGYPHRLINPETGAGLSNKGAECVSQTSTPRPSMDENATAYESMMREIAVLKKLDHPHVVKLHEVIDSPSATYMMLVMEFMEQGPVQNTKNQTGFHRFSESEAVEYFRQACLGLDYLHYNHVVHGDLKPENLLVNTEGKLKIADFGSARWLFFPSEMSISPALQDLLNRLLDKNPASRASLQEAMQHPWITSGGANPLPSMSMLTSPPKVVEVSKDEAQSAVSQSPLVNMIRTKLKEKHCDQGSYIFREGDTANCVFMIMSGAVEIIRRLDSTAALDDMTNSLDDMDVVDMDESFALEAGHELIPPGMDVKDGMLHVNRQKVFGEVSLEPDQAVQYKYSARARTSKVVVVKLTEEAMLRGLLQQLSGEGGNAEDSDAFSMMPTENSFALGKSQPLQTIEDDAAADVQGW
ncbi:hypothetical protein DUNSADRAFT_16634 [Dunaliella salina]|uniref:cGMP-dependent protein kinase n=1 Tax=Dunaliella salina TaxID=3046 RepID=A0ABQ7G371_DUNSA|nr:hypothetical protein DUNSADRAFT_16634 [Dunaliella salina]|eukprot:KAF5829050.1 hypothetical protein DUNSADRAFT_16634 [Dunaliella salina]